MVTSTDAKIRFLSSLLLVSIVFAIGAYFLFVGDVEKKKENLTFADMKRNKKYREMLSKASVWAGNFVSRFRRLNL